MSKLAIGTVQFGLDYGIANQSGQPPIAESGRILDVAKKSGIDVLDTAIAYGDSENILGRLGVDDFKIVTKLPAVPFGLDDIHSWVEEQVHASLTRLGLESVHGLLLHRSKDLLQQSGKDLIATLNEVKVKGLVEKIGVSIYDPEELEQVTQLIKIDIVQGPLNLIDRRLETSGWLNKLFQEGVDVHTRSVFLQGLLLMPRDKIPAKFEKWSLIWDQWKSKLKERNVSGLAACLSYPCSLQ